MLVFIMGSFYWEQYWDLPCASQGRSVTLASSPTSIAAAPAASVVHGRFDAWLEIKSTQSIARGFIPDVPDPAHPRTGKVQKQIKRMPALPRYCDK